MSTANISVDLTPILGEIARRWNRIGPSDLTAAEALRLLGVLVEVADRLNDEDRAQTAQVFPLRVTRP